MLLFILKQILLVRQISKHLMLLFIQRNYAIS
nr:MAG TPA: hypothetical protein [Caudoviricetes sp.]